MSSRTTIVLWRDIYAIADKVCKHFGLRYGRILPETRMRTRHYGECRPCDKCCKAKHIDEKNCSEKLLYIRLHQLNKPRVPLSTKTIIVTLAHELAHLREWKHGPRHAAFEKEILKYIKEEIGYIY